MKIKIEIDLNHFLHIGIELPLALKALANEIAKTGIIPTQVILPIPGDRLVVGTINKE